MLTYVANYLSSVATSTSVYRIVNLMVLTYTVSTTTYRVTVDILTNTVLGIYRN